MSDLTHFNDSGDAHMVDVGAKAITDRKAVVEGWISMKAETLALISSGGHKKGDVLGIARIAGIMAAKRTADLIPLCHPIMLTSVSVEFTVDESAQRVCAIATTQTSERTGVEMEALTAVQVALMTIYDMCKAVDRGMTIGGVQLIEKAGGKSGIGCDLMASPDIQSDPSCMDDFDPNSIRVEDAIAHIQHSITPVTDAVSVPVRDALWRVLARDVTAAIDVPNHNNSAMDGYAVRFGDLDPSGVVALTLAGTSFAGKPFTGSLNANECVRIMTGAIIPQGADTVVMQEDVDREDHIVRIGQGHKHGQFVRLAGDDVAENSVVLQQGKRVTPADVGLLATCGVGEVNVVRRLRVAFMSTGDELRAIGESLSPGDVYDSNRYSLHAMLSRLGVEVLDLGVIADDPQAVRDAFARASNMADAVVVSGGASVGDADFVHATLQEMGEVNFWKIAMKPGRPLAYGRVGDALFFGLPGNPVSVIVTFYQFVTPALKRLMGMTQTLPLRIPVTLDSTIKKSPGRNRVSTGDPISG